MSFKFEPFEDTETSFAAKVTIRQRTGQLGFTAGAQNLYKIKEYNFCKFYFDHQRHVVGLEMTTDEKSGSVVIKKGETNTYVRAKNFLDRFGVDYRESHRYDLRKDEESGFLYFELEKELGNTAEPAMQKRQDAPDNAEAGADKEPAHQTDHGRDAQNIEHDALEREGADESIVPSLDGN